jgi:hypothetical protein
LGKKRKNLKTFYFPPRRTIFWEKKIAKNREKKTADFAKIAKKIGSFYCINGGTVNGTTGACTCTNCDTGFQGPNCADDVPLVYSLRREAAKLNAGFLAAEAKIKDISDRLDVIDLTWGNNLRK